MRRKDRETTRDVALSIIDKCAYAVLSMIDENGMPYAIPISTVRVENCIYFHGATEGKKADCIKNNEHVFMTFVGDISKPKDSFTTNYESACVFGKATVVTSIEKMKEIMHVMCSFQTPENMHNFEKAFADDAYHMALWKVEIEELTGKIR